MRIARIAACAALAIVAVAALLAGVLPGHSYAVQDRAAISAPPSMQFPLGTDELGRDRFARLLQGSRVSLLLAPAAALVSTMIAAFCGGLAAFLGGRWERLFTASTDAFLSLPWLFLLLAARAMLPLNVSPLVSVVVTFGLLALLGWPGTARIVRAGMRGLLDSGYVLQARAGGISRMRVFWRHLLPNLRPILLAQFWIAVPLYILSEANLSLLGLGVAEPLPSLGSMLKELEDYSMVGRCPWVLAPALLLVGVTSCFQILVRAEEVPSA